jgi:uncharacterized membrane protein YeaQ/YmgE (transglycosylase-associated protein family)
VGLFAWIVLGLIAGALAKAATGTNRRGCLFTIVVGILGAVVGGLLFNAIGENGITEFNLWSILVAFIGASLLLLVLQAISRR